MPALDREGIFEARITDARIETAGSGSIMAYLDFEVLRQYDKSSKTYSEPWPEGHTFSGSVCLVKKDGSPMNDAIKRLVKATGWNGKSGEIGHIIGRDCKCRVADEPYNGQSYYRAKYIDPIGGEANTEEIAARFDQYFTALAAEVGPITPAPATAPAPAPAPPPAPPAPPAIAQPDPNDTVNF